MDDGKTTEDADKVDLEKQKLRLEISELGSKTDTVGRLSAKYWAVIAALLTFYIGFVQNHMNQKNNEHQLVNSAVQAATDIENSQRQIAGIWALDEFLKEDYEAYETTITSTLAADLLDNDKRVHCEAAEVLGEAITGPDGFYGRQAEARSKRLARSLYGDAKDGSVGIVTRLNSVLRAEAEKRAEKAEPVADEISAETYSPPPVRFCETPLDATKEAIRRNWEYLRSVNLDRTELARAKRIP
jgi:hypothetical protein